MTLDELLASGRHVITYGAGFATAIGVVTASQSADIQTDVNHIFNGIKEIAIGAGPLIGIVMGWWATHRSTPAAKVADVSAMPSTKGFATSDPELATVARVADVGTAVTLVPPTAVPPKGVAA